MQKFHLSATVPYPPARLPRPSPTRVSAILPTVWGSVMPNTLPLFVDAIVAPLSERILWCTKGHDRPCTVRLHHYCPAVSSVQWLCGRLVSSQEGADGVFRSLLHLLCWLSGSLNAISIYHCQNATWRALWRLDSSQLDNGHRCAAFVTTY